MARPDKRQARGVSQLKKYARLVLRAPRRCDITPLQLAIAYTRYVQLCAHPMDTHCVEQCKVEGLFCVL